MGSPGLGTSNVRDPPALRYRTGDWASLVHRDGEAILVGLTGRPPVRFRTPDGEWINNIEVTHAVRPFAVAQLTLHQDESGVLRLGLDRRTTERDRIVQAVRELFGSDVPLEVVDETTFDDKIVQYTSDVPGATV